MTVTAFRIQNFMGFEDSGWIELRPITLLFGRNSSGKSALIRALLLLRQSLESEPSGGALLFVKDDGLDFGDYQEIVHDHDTRKDISFWFRLRFHVKSSSDEGRLYEDQLFNRVLDAINFFLVPREVKPEDRPKIQVVTIKIVIGIYPDKLPSLKAFVMRDSQDDILLSATHQEATQETGNLWSYATDFFNLHDEANTVIWPFVEAYSTLGFLPKVRLIHDATEGGDREPSDDLGPQYQNGWWILEGLRHSLRSFFETLTYLGPLRSAPERFYYVAGQSISTPEHGKHFVRNLVKAKASSREAINDWLRASRMSYRLQLEPLDERKTLYELRLQELSEDQQVKVSANIREVGFGLTQMLPIVTQAVLAQSGDTLIIEQPELHLHPRAQVDLTDLFIVMARQGTHFLIETHSEHLLLRLRRCIAETHLKSLENKLEIPEQDAKTPTPELRPLLWPEDVAAYFVERLASAPASLVTPLEIDRFGDLPTSQGFADFFSDDAREILAITRAALAAEGLEEQAS